MSPLQRKNVEPGAPARSTGAMSFPTEVCRSANGTTGRPKGSATTGFVLLIEDDPRFSELLRERLEGDGHAVSAAALGCDGLTAAFEQRPDVIILDLNLPDMNGLDICARIKESPDYRHIPIMILTAETELDVQLRARVECHADHYMTKPIANYGEFHAWIAAFMAKSLAARDPEDVRLGADLLINAKEHAVVVQGRTISNLSVTLFDLLREFAKHPRKVLSVEHLEKSVWNGVVRDRTVERAVHRLNEALGTGEHGWFSHVRGQGFLMIPQTPPKASKKRIS